MSEDRYGAARWLDDWVRIHAVAREGQALLQSGVNENKLRQLDRQGRWLNVTIACF